MKSNDLHPDLQALFDEAASLPEPDLKGLAETNRALASNPEFAAKVNCHHLKEGGFLEGEL